MEVILYIDPTTGGMLLQVLLGSVVGGFVVVKLFVLSWFRRGKRGAAEPLAEERGPSDDLDEPSQSAPPRES